MRLTVRLKGGPGSGHRGHSGRPGKRGGSSPGRGGAVGGSSPPKGWLVTPKGWSFLGEADDADPHYYRRQGRLEISIYPTDEQDLSEGWELGIDAVSGKWRPIRESHDTFGQVLESVRHRVHLSTGPKIQM